MHNRMTSRPRKPQGNTIPVQGETQERRPREPYEHDESASSQAPGDPTMQRIGKIAHDDVAAGRTDTDKGPVLDRTYHEIRKDGGRGD